MAPPLSAAILNQCTESGHGSLQGNILNLCLNPASSYEDILAQPNLFPVMNIFLVLFYQQISEQGKSSCQCSYSMNALINRWKR